MSNPTTPESRGASEAGEASSVSPKPRALTFDEYTERVNSLKTMGDVTSFVRDLVAPTIQTMLEAEMEQHLGYPRYDAAGRGTGNSRNGHSKKRVKGVQAGTVDLNIPRDRNSRFEPIVVQKYATIESELEERVIALYAKGLTTRDIQMYLKDIYGVVASPEMISHITDKIMPLVQEWQSRPLCRVYPIMYLDAVHFKVKENGKIMSKAAYTMLGIREDGFKEIVGIWVGENEGAKFWLRLLNEIKNRGVEDILICCIDGLTGFSDAIHTVYPEAKIQQCIVHQIRNTTKYVNWKERKAFCRDLKNVYGAPSEEAGYEELQTMKKKWKDYGIYLESWERKWTELATFFEYPEEIRKIIYTTNPLEGLHRQLRKVTKTTIIFPHDESLMKLLFLAQRDISKKWTMPIRDWGKIIAQFAIMFPDRISIN
jgi:putative transposase